jgi:hypothetical protein
LAQFSRGGIVDDLVAKITENFAVNLKASYLKASLSGAIADARQSSGTGAALQVGTLLCDRFLWLVLRRGLHDFSASRTLKKCPGMSSMTNTRTRA